MNFDMLLSLGITILLTYIKNPEKRAEIKKVALKVRNSINAAYASDPDFQ